MKLGIFAIPSCLTSYYDAVDWAVKNGFDAVEPFCSLEVATPGPEGVRAAKRFGDHAREMGISVPCFSICLDILTDPEGAETLLKGYADMAAAMGSPLLHHTIYYELCETPVSAFAALEAQTEKAVGVINRVAEYAAGLGVTLCYEDQGFVFNGVYRFGTLLEALGDKVGVVADLGNVLFVDETPANFLRAFGKRVVHVHVKDYLRSPGSRGEGYATRYGSTLTETLVGDGSVDYPAVCRLLQEAGYDGTCCLEYCRDGEEAPRLECARRFRAYWQGKLPR